MVTVRHLLGTKIENHGLRLVVVLRPRAPFVEASRARQRHRGRMAVGSDSEGSDLGTENFGLGEGSGLCRSHFGPGDKGSGLDNEDSDPNRAAVVLVVGPNSSWRKGRKGHNLT